MVGWAADGTSSVAAWADWLVTSTAAVGGYRTRNWAYVSGMLTLLSVTTAIVCGGISKSLESDRDDEIARPEDDDESNVIWLPAPDNDPRS